MKSQRQEDIYRDILAVSAAAPPSPVPDPGDRQLALAVAEDLSGVSARWLGGVAPAFETLIAKAEDGTLSDDDLIAALEKASQQFPELYGHLNHGAVETALVKAMACDKPKAGDMGDQKKDKHGV